MPNHIELNDKVRMAREMLGLSQRQLATILGVNQGSISHWEHGGNCPLPTARQKIVSWLNEAEKQLGAAPDLSPNPMTIATHTTSETWHRMTPALKQQVIRRLREGASHRQIKAELHVDLHTITNIRHEAHIPVQSQTSKQAEHIEEAWNAARNETRALAPSKLPDADKVRFAVALEDIRAWLTRYVQANLADALEPKKLREEIKRVLK